MIKKYSNLILCFFIYLNVFAQDQEKTVEITTTGIGKTESEAKDNAIHSALEQAFGAFISSKTEMLNDKIVSEQMSSVTSGNVQSFEILSKNQNNDGLTEVILKAKISVEKLISFCENKGVKAEFKGALFALNIKQQQINKENEYKILQNASIEVFKMLNKCFDYSISIEEPTSIDNNLFKIPVTVEGKINNNIINVATYLNGVLKGITLSIDEVAILRKYNLKLYGLTYQFDESYSTTYILRNEKSIDLIQKIAYSLRNSFYSFTINNGIEIINGRNFNYNITEEDRFYGPSPHNCVGKLKSTNNQKTINNQRIFTKNMLIGYSERGGCNIDICDNEYTINFLHPMRDFQVMIPIDSEGYIGWGRMVGGSLNSTINKIIGLENKKLEFLKEQNITVLRLFFNVGVSGGKLQFENIYNVDELNKISEYKIQPMN